MNTQTNYRGYAIIKANNVSKDLNRKTGQTERYYMVNVVEDWALLGTPATIEAAKSIIDNYLSK